VNFSKTDDNIIGQNQTLQENEIKKVNNLDFYKSLAEISYKEVELEKSKSALLIQAEKQQKDSHINTIEKSYEDQMSWMTTQ